MPGKWDEFEAAWTEASDALGPQPGLKSRTLMRDRDDSDAFYSVSWWESVDEMNRYERGANVEFIERVEPFAPVAHMINHLDVVYSKEYEEMAPA
jgi:heme-degrading monooxygenase HmoA